MDGAPREMAGNVNSSGQPRSSRVRSAHIKKTKLSYSIYISITTVRPWVLFAEAMSNVQYWYKKAWGRQRAKILLASMTSAI